MVAAFKLDRYLGLATRVNCYQPEDLFRKYSTFPAHFICRATPKMNDMNLGVVLTNFQRTEAVKVFESVFEEFLPDKMRVLAFTWSRAGNRPYVLADDFTPPAAYTSIVSRYQLPGSDRIRRMTVMPLASFLAVLPWSPAVEQQFG